MSGLVLMENASRGVAEEICKHYRPTRVAILCGKGNNAGDGYAIARHLDFKSWPVSIIQLSPPNELVGDAKENWRISQKAEICTSTINISSAGQFSSADPLQGAMHRLLNEWLSDAGIIVDCLLGTGASGAPKFPFDVAIEIANATAAGRIAVDIPTGLDCDTGVPSSPCFRAERTCTFVASKPGFDNPDSTEFVGQVHIIDIGIPRRLLRELSTQIEQQRA